MYVTAPTDGHEYTSVCPHKPFVIPVIDAGVLETAVERLRQRDAVFTPQMLVATTHKLAELNPGRIVALILLLVDEPLVFAGNVQV